MRKDITLKLILTIAFGFGLVSSNANDVSNMEPYRSTIGLKFKTLESCYIFKLPYSHKAYLGVYHSTGAGRTLPPEIDKRFVGKTWKNNLIVGIAPVGTRLTVAAVERDISGDGDFVSFMCRLAMPGFNEALMDIRFVQISDDGRGGRLPVVSPTFAVRETDSPAKK